MTLRQRLFAFGSALTLLLPLLSVVALLSPPWHRQRRPQPRLRHLHRLALGLETGPTAAGGASSSSFDMTLAVILAGYSFQAYLDPPAGKVAYGVDGTDITFCSADYVKRVFAGALLVDLVRGQFTGAKEDSLLERVLTGAEPDPRVVVSVVEAPTTAGARARVLDRYVVV